MTRSNQDIPTDSANRYIAGDTARIVTEVTLTDSADDDLSAADITFVLANAPGATPVITKTRDDGITVPDEDPTQCVILITSDDTENLGGIGGEDYYYEIEITDSNGDVATVTTGTWTIHPNTA